MTCLFIVVKEGLREGRIVVHCHDFNTLPVGWLLRFLSGRFRLVYDSHENFPAFVLTIAPKIVAAIVKAVERFMLARVDGLIAANDVILQNLQPYSKVGGEAIYNTPPLTVSQFSKQQAETEILRLKDESGEGTFVLLYYGAITQHRGLYQLLDAASLASKNPSSKVAFVIVGDGPLASHLRSEAQERDLTQRVRFYSHVPFDRAMHTVKAADAVYIGFEPEDLNNYFASPNKLFEAMAMGTPVLASGFGLLGRLVQELGCGVTMKTITGTAILSCIQRLSRKAVRNKCAANGLYWFRTKYNWEEMEDRLGTVYRHVAPLDIA
jgi:glycosyltransferase involved in cell wall biosynthesis